MPGEFDLIARYLRPLAAGAAGALGLTDDAAILTPPAGEDLVLAADAMVAGVHFLPDDPAETVGRKLLRVNLSDLAAMGARPLGYLMTLALPAQDSEAWLAAFASGLAGDQAVFDLQLLGGDMTRTDGPATVSLTILGAAPAGRRLTRAAARPGEQLYVSGSIGDGALGLALLQGRLSHGDPAFRDHLIARYRLPQPRLALGQALLSEGLAACAIDVSDGLLADAGHISETSGCRLEIDAGRVPHGVAAQALLAERPELAQTLVTAGDDYELLFSAAEAEAAALESLARRLDLPLTCIGRVVAGAGAVLLDSEGREIALPSAGWRHF